MTTSKINVYGAENALNKTVIVPFLEYLQHKTEFYAILFLILEKHYFDLFLFLTINISLISVFFLRFQKYTCQLHNA